jgi:dTDP-4-dehydrorhamnose reductase
MSGGTGQVGTGLMLANRGRFEIVAPTRADFDLLDAASIERNIAARDWAAIINCAAYTAVDKAESEPQAAFAINAEAPGIMARAAAARAIPLLHVSTDYVFDGSKPDAYSEEDPVAPLGVYGASKEAGERAVRDAGGRSIILRTAWVVSPWGHNFVKTMLRLGGERDELGVVADQVGCPTSAIDIAETLLILAERLLGDRREPCGTYHFVNSGQASWYDLASAVFAYAGARGMKIPRVNAIATADYPTPARRPANSRLSTAKLERTFGMKPRPWQEAVEEILVSLIDAGGKS